jgi:hypothetical protein
MKEYYVSVLAMDKIDTIFAGTNMLFNNQGNSTIIIDVEEVLYQQSEGTPQYFNALSDIIPIDPANSMILVSLE